MDFICKALAMVEFESKIKKNSFVKTRQRTVKALDGFGTHVGFACFLVSCKTWPEPALPDSKFFFGGATYSCTGDDDYADDVEGDEDVLQLISLIDSRRRPEGSSGERCKTTGARAEARAVITQPLAPEVPLILTGHLGHRVPRTRGKSIWTSSLHVKLSNILIIKYWPRANLVELNLKNAIWQQHEKHTSDICLYRDIYRC